MKKNHFILISVVLAILLFFSLKFTIEELNKPEGFLLNERWTVSHDNAVHEILLPSFTSIADEGVYTYSTEFPGMDVDTLIIPSFSAYGYEIQINGLMIARLNEVETKTSNIWNQIQMFTFDPDILGETNTLMIKIFGIFDHGINQIPYLTKQKTILPKITIAGFFQNSFYFISFGICISFGLILLMLGYTIPDNKDSHYSFGIAVFFACIYLLDFPARNFSGNMFFFLIQRKFIYASTYLAVFFLMRGMEFFIFKRASLSKYIKYIVFSLVSVLCFLPDFKTLKIVNSFGLFMLLFMIIIIYLYVLIKKQRIFMFSTTFLILCTIHDTINALTASSAIFLISYGIIILIIALEIIIISFFKKTYGNMITAHNKALKDPLTGAFNRNILDAIEPDPEDVLIMIDFDRFKEINDKFGHDEGDEVLKLFVRESLLQLRETDLIIRLGGDEFVILMKGCSNTIAESRIQNIEKVLSKEIRKYPFSFSFGICDLGCGIEEAFKKADVMLYIMKNTSHQKEATND